MKLVIAGAVNGKIQQTYQTITAQHKDIDWLLCTGSLGSWVDPARIDRATRLKEGAGDFAKLYVSGWQAPIQSLFISGVHEDHNWLKHRLEIGNLETLNNVHWLANGYKTVIGDLDDQLRVTGFGKAYSENTFNGRTSKKSKRHYSRGEFEKACSSGPTDILLLHEPPKNEYIRRLIFAVRPKLICHSSFLDTEPYTIMGTPTIAVKKDERRVIEFTKDIGFQW